MSYDEKLKDPRWQRKRLEIMEKANFTCEDCGSKDKTLHVHHCIYVKGKEPWEYNANALMCICEDCHESRADLEKTAHQWLAVIMRFSPRPKLAIVQDVLDEMMRDKRSRYVPAAGE